MEALFALVWLVLSVAVIIGFFMIVVRLGVLVEAQKETRDLLRLLVNEVRKQGQVNRYSR